jgi:hypothetical protein
MHLNIMRKTDTSTHNSRHEAARNRGFNAMARVRRGDSPSLSHAARVEGTTVKFVRETFPAALIQARPGGRIRVKAGDSYSATVEILSDQGAVVVKARSSRQRELAGQHRATFMRVLQGQEPPSALEQYRGKKIGGHELISDYEVLRSFAEAGDVGQLESLYVSPDVSS